MSIALRSNQQAAAATLTMPTHQAGDLLLTFAWNDNSATAPTIPSGWVTRYNVGAATGTIVCAYRIAQSNSESFGTWTNADHVSVSVWYGGANTTIQPHFIIASNGTSTSIGWAAQTAGTFQSNAEDQALVAWGVNRNTTNDLSQTLGALTNLFQQGDGANFQVAVKYQLARTTIWASTSLTVTTSSFWRTLMVSLVEQTAYGVTGGGAMFFRPGMNGGMD